MNGVPPQDDVRPSVGSAELTNEVTIGDDGWAQLAPFGDHPGEVFIVNTDGTTTKGPAIQRMDLAAAQGMVDRFHSLGGKIRRWMTGVNIFSGHPDQPGRGHEYPDKGAKGVIADLAVRETGLFARPIFNNEGQTLLEARSGLAFSARWSADYVGDEGGKRVFRPSRLLSAGLTDRPNLPVQAINESPTMPDLTKLIIALRKYGLSLDDAMSIDQLVDAVENGAASLQTQAANAASTAQQVGVLTARVGELEGQLTNDRTVAEGIRTELANARTRLGGALFDAALREGRVAEADRAGFIEHFAGDFANAEAELAKRTSGSLKTTSSVAGNRAQGDVAADVQGRRSLAMQLVNERQAAGEDYDTAFAKVRASRPDLFGTK